MLKMFRNSGLHLLKLKFIFPVAGFGSNAFSEMPGFEKILEDK